MHNSQRISCKQFISQTRPLSAAFPGFAMGLCFLLACGAAMAGDVYRWTDSDGTVHFGEHPPQGVSATRLSTSTGKRSTREPKAKTTSESGSTEEAVNTDGEDKKATASAKPPKPTHMLFSNWRRDAVRKPSRSYAADSFISRRCIHWRTAALGRKQSMPSCGPRTLKNER